MRFRLSAAIACSVCLHLLPAVLLLWLTPLPPAAQTPTGRSMAAFIVAPTEDATFAGLKPIDQLPAPAVDAKALSVANLEIDLRAISERIDVLFPFLTPGLALDRFFPVAGQERHTTFDRSFLAPQNPQARAAKRALVLTAPALQRLIDRSWSREHRWRAFDPIQRLAGSYDPDSGAVPAVIREYQRQNALQPFTDTEERDPRLWAQLSLAADHVSFIGFVRRYVSSHPSARAATECLFLLETIAEANRDALTVLLDSDPNRQLLLTRGTSPPAYQLIVRIRGRYRATLNRLGLTTAEAIDARYDQVRLAILAGILRTTPQGYGATDARFLMGSIHWNAHREREALQVWREMTSDNRTVYAAASAAIQSALRRNPGHDADSSAQLHHEIKNILANEQGQWLSFSEQRLHRFGYRVDTF